MIIKVDVPDNWPRGKSWSSHHIMTCQYDPCDYATISAALFLKHMFSCKFKKSEVIKIPQRDTAGKIIE